MNDIIYIIKDIKSGLYIQYGYGKNPYFTTVGRAKSSRTRFLKEENTDFVGEEKYKPENLKIVRCELCEREFIE